jgi:hypothetical protein
MYLIAVGSSPDKSEKYFLINEYFFLNKKSYFLTPSPSPKERVAKGSFLFLEKKEFMKNGVADSRISCLMCKYYLN